MAQRFGSSTLHQRDSRSALFEGYDGGTGTHSPSYHGHGYRAATPNRKGQYSDAVLNELESQNEDQVAGILGKVRTLKDMTVAIGDEIRESSALADKMNDAFDNTRMRVRGTMNRMKIMAERTGVGWKVWLLFFAAVGMLFFYVWLF
ncbi:Target SNARE coiled-coil domain protein [Metarhizium rileyi]|uniref:Protein transport protein bet1 n=1 Tax=Metarhizium rileyi (strain RCEF 4871) TaxID=1649241 RepID=A0A167CNL9_METRR|nr:Target SNARE coiled-coil domain protein [Metarhizium rileyi RCEF 4871]TWU74147.1 protein transport protein bet1 [Metarhizium rileyi]